MANISKIKLPDGVTYNLKDNISGYVTTDENVTQTEVSSSIDTGLYELLFSESDNNVTTVTTGTKKNNHFYIDLATDSLQIPKLQFMTSNSQMAFLSANNITSTRSYGLPDESGTIALTADIPTNVSAFVNDAGYLTSHQSIKTINSTSLLGSGDIAVQPTLVSGTNIKTVNNESLLGSGNISIAANYQSGTSALIEAGSNTTDSVWTPKILHDYIADATGSIGYITKYETTYTTSGTNTTTVPIGISQYTSTDILLVDVNGLDLIQGTDFTINGTNIVLTNAITTSGTPVHIVDLKMVAATVGQYSNLKGETGAAAGFGTPTATINNAVGTPSVTVTASGANTAKVFNFAFTNLKGETGAAAGFGTPTASVTNTVGTPGVTITSSGANTAKVFNFAFTNLKGEKGDKGDPGTHTISYTSLINSGQQAGTLTIDGVSTPVYANVVWQ